jgi:hypothetical protein
MAISRFNPTLLFVLVFSLACISREGAPEAAQSTVEDKIQKIQIRHVTPRPDYVGKLPTVLEWTAAAGADSYAVQVENEIEIPVFEQDGIAGTSTPWPKDFRIEPGTYYWRVAGLKGDRVIADSGRAAFVVHEP